MISKQYIKGLEFNNIGDIFNYIVESEINGAYSQVREIVKKLSSSQYIEIKNIFLKGLFQ